MANVSKYTDISFTGKEMVYWEGDNTTWWRDMYPA